MNQNACQISCMCQYKLGRRWENLKFQWIYAKHFNVKNQIESMFATICNTYCIIHCKIKIICLINLQKLNSVHQILYLLLSSKILSQVQSLFNLSLKLGVNYSKVVNFVIKKKSTEFQVLIISFLCLLCKMI